MISKFRFCPACKNSVTSPAERLINCDNCGFHLYLSPASTNALILENSKGEILLTKRKHAPKKGYWDTPGGFINLKENVEESLIREIEEELGFRPKKIKYFSSYWSYYPYRGMNYQTLCHVYTSKYNGEKIMDQDDISAHQFFPKNKIPFEKISFEDIKQALRAYVKSSP